MGRGAVIAWLNANAGAIQGIASGVTVIVTVVLVGVTWWYAALTKRIARAAERQLEFLAHPRETKRNRLRFVVDELRGTMPAQIPEDDENLDRLMEFYTARERLILARIEELGQLAAEFGDEIAAKASVAHRALTNLREYTELRGMLKQLQNRFRQDMTTAIEVLDAIAARLLAGTGERT